MNKSDWVWETLLRNKEEIVSHDDLVAISKKLGLNPVSTVRTLRHRHVLEPLFKGYYYVKDPREAVLNESRIGPLDLFAAGAKAKGIGRWYFGLHTALRLNGLTHEHRTDEFVVSDAFYRPTGVPIAGRRFRILKWSPRVMGFGLRRRGPWRYSDPEKTILDLAYWDAWRTRHGSTPTGVWREHAPSADRGRMRDYLDHYPDDVRKLVEGRR